MTRPIPPRLRAWAGLLALCLLACAQPAASLREAAPALWRAERPQPGEGTLYLLGSVHMGDAGGFDLGSEVDAAWQLSDELVVEVDLSRVAPEEMVSLTRLYGTLAPPLRLSSVISLETLGQLEAWFALRGLDPAALAQFKPWFVAFTVVQVELQLAGYDAADGVDRRFLDAATGRKPIVALETVASQLEMLGTEPRTREEVQAALQKDTRWSPTEIDGGMDELLRVQAIAPVNEVPQPIPKVIPLEPFPAWSYPMKRGWFQSEFARPPNQPTIRRGRRCRTRQSAFQHRNPLGKLQNVCRWALQKQIVVTLDGFQKRRPN